MSSNRNTTTRDRHRKQLRRGEPPCAICGQPIDYALPYLHPMEYVVDHIIPDAAGGPDTIENKQPSHRRCNRDKSDTIGYEPGVTPEPLKRARTY